MIQITKRAQRELSKVLEASPTKSVRLFIEGFG
jgi:Fe-S cluster assembly iron-binding protein IscA